MRWTADNWQWLSSSSWFAVSDSYGLSPDRLWNCIIYGHGEIMENQCWKGHPDLLAAGVCVIVITNCGLCDCHKCDDVILHCRCRPMFTVGRDTCHCSQPRRSAADIWCWRQQRRWRILWQCRHVKLSCKTDRNGFSCKFSLTSAVRVGFTTVRLKFFKSIPWKERVSPWISLMIRENGIYFQIEQLLVYYWFRPGLRWFMLD